MRVAAVAAASLLLAGPAFGAPAALILRDAALPGQDTALAPAVQGMLREAGYAPEGRTVEQLAEADALTPERCALLVLPQAGALPTVLAPPLQAYLKAGGRLMALGVPAWGTPLVRDGARWVSADAFAESRALLPPEHTVLDFSPAEGLERWRRTSNTLESPAHAELTTATANGRQTGALHVTISNLAGWDTYDSGPVERPFLDGATRTVFSAKGGPRTRSLSVEWEERDGSRWIAVVPLTTRWRHYSLTPQAFRSWANSPERAAQGFHPRDAARFRVGLAFTHTGTVGGAHEYWISPVGTNAEEEADLTSELAKIQPIDTVAPRYKFFPVSRPARLAAAPGQTIVTGPLSAAAADTVLMSSSPRPATGYDKGRQWRWVSLLEARDVKTGEWRGTPATLLIHTPDGPYHGGIWAAFAVPDPAFYRRPATLAVLRRTAERMRDGLFFLEAGASEYAYFAGQSVRMGYAINTGALPPRAAVRVTVVGPNGAAALRRTFPPDQARELTWTPPAWPRDGFTVKFDLLRDGATVDRVQHPIACWIPPARPNYIAIRPDGHFYDSGKLWRIHGVNYMPSSGIGQEDGNIFEHWIGRQGYDPAVIERDLTRVQQLGMNAVSAFIYTGSTNSQNLLDFLLRCRAHKLRVNLSLRPGVPEHLRDGKTLDDAIRDLTGMVKQYRTAADDTVFAYEVAWEPSFGDQKARRLMDPAWRKWVVARYGSVEGAERAWGVPAPRDETGELTNPAGAQIGGQGPPAVKLVADYRAFLDDWLAETYGAMTRALHAIAPRQYVSFRMASTGNPDDWQGGELPYQFAGLDRAVDFLSPECYGRVGNPTSELGLLFESSYGRGIAPNKPFFWAETGVSAWNEQQQADDAVGLDFQARYISMFYRLARQSGSDGVFLWWYPGGFRVGENSDYGIINPDGTDRPSTRIVRAEAAKLRGAPVVTPNVWLEYNRNEHPNGIYGIFQQLKGKFEAAIKAGKWPGLRPAPGTPGSRARREG